MSEPSPHMILKAHSSFKKEVREPKVNMLFADLSQRIYRLDIKNKFF